MGRTPYLGPQTFTVVLLHLDEFRFVLGNRLRANCGRHHRCVHSRLEKLKSRVSRHILWKQQSKTQKIKKLTAVRVELSSSTKAVTSASSSEPSSMSSSSVKSKNKTNQNHLRLKTQEETHLRKTHPAPPHLQPSKLSQV